MTSRPVNDGVPAGKTAAGLLAQAETLTSAASKGSLYTRLTSVLASVNTLSVTLAQDRTAETKARRALRVAGDGAASARRDYRALTAALKATAIRLYMTGPVLATPHNLTTLNQLLYASSYEETALGPQGILERRRLDVTIEKRSLAKARTMQAVLAADTRHVQAELTALRSESKQLTIRLAAFDDTTAAAMAAEEQTLAAQASTKLLSPTALELPSTPSSSASPGTSASSASSAPPALASSSPPPTPLSTTQVALQWAFAELGKPYLWGGTGPDAFDCSGLTQFVWAQAGVSIPRTSEDQFAWAIPVPLSQLLPGDLVFFGTTDIHHVGIYIGGGLMINAPHTGTVVQISSIWWSDLAGFGRVHAPGVPVPAHAVPTPANPATPAVVPSAGPVPSESAPPPGSTAPGSTAPPPTRPASSPTPTSGSPTASTTILKAPTTTSPTQTTPPTVAPPLATTTSTSPPSDATPPSDTTTSTSPPSDKTPVTTTPPSGTTTATTPPTTTPPSDTTTPPTS